ncbi:hypothetical protein NDU88_002455 [Pleurodeles waltl]|uniref:Uncharacterized protein n=1 Tax=Pleurodeles waltl TaxID=8319 RepID=A0AAV7Q8U9_PLEWA|nr:hypothetical protein NDU88_002455 [Pleurodeles waltl]
MTLPRNEYRLFNNNYTPPLTPDNDNTPLPMPPAEFVFLLAELWGIDNSARYQAVELLDRFMIKHTEEEYKNSAESRKKSQQTEKERWSSIKSHLCETFVLRLVSCVQIASKLTFHCNMVNNKAALKFIQSLGFSYKKEEILQSELTVLKTLKFQINVCTPFSFVEMLLEVLECLTVFLFCLSPYKDILETPYLIHAFKHPLHSSLDTSDTEVASDSSMSTMIYEIR